MKVPEFRDGTKAEEAALNLLLDEVVNEWKKLPHRGTDLKCVNCVITDDVELLLKLTSIQLIKINSLPTAVFIIQSLQ